jgi:hypothetical protein
MFVSARFYPNIFRFDKYLASYRRDVPKGYVGLYVKCPVVLVQCPVVIVQCPVVLV